MAIDERVAWQKVRARRAGDFVYCVSTTGIYCRPTCPSRRPRRANVRFVASAAEASRAGFRACLRCRPDDAAEPNAEIVTRVCRAIDQALEAGDPVTLQSLSAVASLSPGRLQRVFKQATGVSPRVWAAERRATLFRRRLREESSVTGAVYAAGYGSESRAYEKVQRRMGMTPASYRAGGAGIAIRFTIVRSRLGRVLVATTDRGLCSVRLGGSDALLERALREEFARASIEGPDGPGRELTRSAARIVAAVDGRKELDSLPIDVRGTAFQFQVWEALRRIPLGQTRSYAEVAASIGRPRAVRAVARACASNPVALVVPCHRVVRGDGAPGDYRWGADRKRRLLAAEDAAAKSSGTVRRDSRADRKE